MAKRQLKVNIVNPPRTREEWEVFGERISHIHHQAISYVLNNDDRLSIEQKRLLPNRLDGKPIIF